MTEKRDLLVEIGTEELPPKALARLSEALTAGLTSQLEFHQLSFIGIRGFATPRRLAVLVSELDVAQSEQQIERKGPAVAGAFDAEGNPTRAAQGFARSCGVTVDQLQVQDTPKGEWLVFRRLQPGKTCVELLPEMVNKALVDLPIPKRMRWGAGKEEFVRPVHWVVLLFGDQVVEQPILGVTPSRASFGHRFLHPQAIEITAPADYPALLETQGRVYVDLNMRRKSIQEQVRTIAAQAGYQALVDPELLDEVTALVEWPNAILGSFDREFLEIPAEALIMTMQEHQKYFPVIDAEGALQPFFITISNIDSQDPEQVRAGNERVIRPRFSDATFFWERDLEQPLEQHIETLKGVVFQKRLGTLYDKSQRIAELAGLVGSYLDVDPALTHRAAVLCKCDLMSSMVGEFPSLQGIMGRYYAEHGGEPKPVSAAMEEQYLPRHAGDKLPESDCGRAIAIADKLDTLMGIFAVGKKPTGVKDPFGLRRSALGVLRILIETPVGLDLEQLLNASANTFASRLDAVPAVEQVFEYMMERLKAYYNERSIHPNVIDAVQARRPTRPHDFDLRVRAVSAFQQLPEAESLAAANKRIRNILRKTDEAYPDQPEPSLLTESSEQLLADRIIGLSHQVQPLFEAGKYTEALTQLATLREAVDRFFDDVMVMCDDAKLRRNRLALLKSLSGLFLRVADISRL